MSLSNLVNAVGNAAESVIRAVQSRNPETVFNAVVIGVGNATSAVTNSVLDPNFGLIATVQGVRESIAQALSTANPDDAAVDGTGAAKDAGATAKSDNGDAHASGVHKRGGKHRKGD